jgi:heme oxygenase
MYLGELPFGATVSTEAFLDIINQLPLFDNLLEPIITDKVLNNEFHAEHSNRSILRNQKG